MRGETPTINMVSFSFDDTDPTADPTTDPITEANMSVQIQDDGEWHSIVIGVPEDLFDAVDGLGVSGGRPISSGVNPAA